MMIKIASHVQEGIKVGVCIFVVPVLYQLCFVHHPPCIFDYLMEVVELLLLPRKWIV